MVAIKNIGKVFDNAKDFLAYLDGLQFGAWRPRFVTMHHTGSPNMKTWTGWQSRAVPVTDEQWLRNLASYYGSDLGWSAGPHFFFTPTHFCVLSPPTARGVHAVSFNALSWGVECVGDFDVENMSPTLKAHYVEGLACLHVAAGLEPDPFVRNVRGLHFHRDDPKTTKTCPGRSVSKPDIVAALTAKIDAMTDGDSPSEQVHLAALLKPRAGKVVNAADGLNIRTDASAKAPVVGELPNGFALEILGEARNGDTLWYKIKDGYVAGRFVRLTP